MSIFSIKPRGKLKDISKLSRNTALCLLAFFIWSVYLIFNAGTPNFVFRVLFYIVCILGNIFSFVLLACFLSEDFKISLFGKCPDDIVQSMPFFKDFSVAVLFTIFALSGNIVFACYNIAVNGVGPMLSFFICIAFYIYLIRAFFSTWTKCKK